MSSDQCRGGDTTQVYEGVTFADYYGADGYDIAPWDIGVHPQTTTWDRMMEPIEKQTARQREQMEIGDVIEYDECRVVKTAPDDYTLQFTERDILTAPTSVIRNIQQALREWRRFIL